jgi:hypothetical protein
MISVRDSGGAIEWEDVDQYFVGDSWGEVILLADSGLLHVGSVDGCDYTSPPSRVRRYSPEGTVLWERMLEPQSYQLVTMAAKGPSDLLALAGQDSVHILDLDGNSVDGWPLQDQGTRLLHWQGDSALFVATGTSLSRVDLDGNTLESTSVGPLVQDLYCDEQHVFVLTNDSVLRFSAALDPLGSIALPSLDYNSSFVTSENDLYINTAAGLHTLSNDGSVALQFPWPELPDLTPTGCAVRNGQVFSLGNTNISGRSTGLVRRLSITGEAAQHDEDVEVLLQVDSSWAEFTGSMWSRKADITGHVVNHGTTVLNEVVVHMWTEVPYIMCVHPGDRDVATALGLQPGDTASIPFGIVDVAIWLSTSQAAGVDDICIVALAPNHLADRYTEDNTSCVSAQFALSENEVDDDPSILLAPNPATGTVLLSGSALTGRTVQLRLLDPAGRVLKDEQFIGTTAGLNLDVSRTPSGAYVVIIDGEGIHAVAHLIVLHP